MAPLDTLRSAFLDELEKIAISCGRLRVAQSRRGRRPMRVETFLRKEKDGTLYKESESSPLVPFASGPYEAGEAKRPRKRGEVPSKEDLDAVQRGDLRENATTVTGLGQTFTNIGNTNHPAEHG